VEQSIELDPKYLCCFMLWGLRRNGHNVIELWVRATLRVPLSTERIGQVLHLYSIRLCYLSALSLQYLGYQLVSLLTINLSFFVFILSHSQLTCTTITSWNCHSIGL
jgi:hypothetical protein